MDLAALEVMDLNRAPTETQLQSKEEKDIIRIAKAFQKAKQETETINDNIAAFMRRVATEDVEQAMEKRLNLDDLYKHIREKMILSKEEIFEGTRTELTVEMSRYFDMLFTSLASHLERVGCEIVTKPGGERACFLTHVRLVRRDAGGVGVGDNGGDVSPDDTLEDETSSNSSYV